MRDGRATARHPEDLPRMLTERCRFGDAAAVAALYEPDAVLIYPPGWVTVGRDAIRVVWAEVLAGVRRAPRTPDAPTFVSGDIALTVTAPEDGSSTRAQVMRRQANGSWLWVIDQPPFDAITSTLRQGERR